jgi:hypothetical protein
MKKKMLFSPVCDIKLKKNLKCVNVKYNLPEDMFTRNYEFCISDRVRKCVLQILNHKMKIKEFVSCLLLARRNKINFGYMTPRKDVQNKLS